MIVFSVTLLLLSIVVLVCVHAKRAERRRQALKEAGLESYTQQ